MIDYYILNPDGTTRRVGVHEWAEWFGEADRFIGYYGRDGWRVSTVFIGIDHNFSGHGPPLLFETIVFDDREDEGQERYSTKDDALIGHARHVRELDKKLDDASKIADLDKILKK